MKIMSIFIFVLILLWFIFLFIYPFLCIRKKMKCKLSVILAVSFFVGLIYATYVLVFI